MCILTGVAIENRSRAVALCALGLLPCLGCDGPWELDHGSPALRNASDVEETVSIRAYGAAFACDAVHSGSSAVSLAGLDEARIVTLRSGATVGLRSERISQPYSGCSAAIVSSARLASPLLITWDLRPAVDAGSSAKGVERGEVYLEPFGAELRPTAGAGMVVDQWHPEDALP